MSAPDLQARRPQPPIRIAHILFHFGIGGLENGLVNLINGLDPLRYQHAIVCLSGYDPSYLERLHGTNYEIRDLHKQPGHDPAVWLRLWRTLRALRPDIVHTRNFVALEMQLVALAAGVRGRVHGEHGWDVQDLGGTVRKYRRARRVLGLAAQRFIALSQDLERYLLQAVGVPRYKVLQIYNGVDCERFRPGPPRAGEVVVLGTVGRMKAVKNQSLLCRAFVALRARRPDLAPRLRLRVIGSGPLLEQCRHIVGAAGCADAVEFAGDSAAVPDELRQMDVFVLPSRAEGISNTILEAMASGLPVIATAVGGNPELVVDGETGRLVAADDEQALSEALEAYAADRALCQRHGAAGRARALARFSLDGMIEAYDGVYRALAG